MGNPDLPPTPSELLENETAKQPIAKGIKSFIGLPFRRPTLKAAASIHPSRPGVLLAGELEKWTNYISQWKPRSYEIVPGVLLVYDSARDNHRDQIPLMMCTIKSVRQLEVIVTRTDGAPLKLRFPSTRARSKWLSIVSKAKQMAGGYFLPSSPGMMTSPSSDTPDMMNKEPDGVEECFTPAEEAVAITRLIESLSRARADYFRAREEVEIISRRLLEHLREAPVPARELATSMLVEQEHIDLIIKKHFSECNAAILQEQKERADLQQCLRREARENYRLGHKLQRVPRSTQLVTQRNSISRRGSGEEFYDMEDSNSMSCSSSEEEEDSIADPAVLTTSAGRSTATPEGGDMVCETPIAPTLATAPVAKFRTRLPKPRTEFKVSLWSLLKDFVGKDLSRIALPVTFNEPNSFLQRLAEDYQYCDLLEKAGTLEDDALRLLHVVAFTITPWQSAVGRTYKPFNPLLGETYEMTHRGFRFMAEQVGHHPPVTAYHTDGASFEAYGHIAVDTKFTGKSLEVQLVGPTTIRVRHPTRHVFETFSYRRPRMVVNNIIFGRISIEVAGTYTITNHTTGYYGVVDYPRGGWWGDMQHPVRAGIYSPDGTCLLRLSGQWSTKLTYQEVPPLPNLKGTELVREETPGLVLGPATSIDEEELKFPPKDIDFVPPWKELEKAVEEQPSHVLWVAEPRPSYSNLYYSFGQMTFELNDMNENYYHLTPATGDESAAAATTDDAADGGGVDELIWLPRTDSRFRPDQKALEEGEVEKSNFEKKRLEEKQRAAARLRGNSEVGYEPQWYERCVDRITGEPSWRFRAEYWERRKFGEVLDIL